MNIESTKVIPELPALSRAGFETWSCQMTPRPRLRPFGSQFSVALWKRPAKLTEDSQNLIYSKLVGVSTRAFGADMAPYWAGRKAGEYFHKISRFALIGQQGGEMIGWTGYHRRKFADSLCLFLDSTGVLPEYQRSGIVHAVQGRLVGGELARRPWARIPLIARTENPIIYCMLRRAAGEGRIHPSQGRVVPRKIREIGREVAAWLGQEGLYDPETLRLLGAYDNLDALYGDLPISQDAALNAFFKASLTPLDAFLVISEASFFAALPYILRGRIKKVTKRLLG